MKVSMLKKYARLIAVAGGGIKDGDEVIIVASLDQPKFVEMLAEECYKAGAEKVSVEWQHQPIAKLKNIYESEKVYSAIADWEIKKWKYRAKRLPVMIYLDSDDPDGLAGIDQKKNTAAIRARAKYIKPIRDTMQSKYKWTIACVPGEAWAKKIFPNLSKKQAIEALWQKIFDVCRMCEDPITAWREHDRTLKERCDYLNSLGIRRLEYKNSIGTSLSVGIIPGCLFKAGGEYTKGGEYFFPNMPTEEVFITPMKGEAEGVVYATKPLSYRGFMIENFHIKFENGKAVEVHAKKGEEALRELIAADEGSAYLGECALVPYNSPINNTGMTFYTTLIDENARCHLALGAGYPENLSDYENMTYEEAISKGVNDSVVHEDFMIGTEDLDVCAVTDSGERIQIFKDGNWAF